MSAVDKVVDIRCSGADYKDISELHEFQGEFKALSKLNFDKLKKTILELGFSDPMNVWENEGRLYLLDGHQRSHVLKALRADGYLVPKVPVNYIQASNRQEAKKKILTFSSNYGAITEESLSDFMIDAEISADFIETDVVFPELNLDYYGEDESEGNEGLSDPDEVPDVKPDPKAKLGDIFVLGAHRLMCGDSASITAAENLMIGNKAEMAFTDPPYNQQGSGGDSDFIGKSLNKQDAEISHMIDFDPADFLNILPLLFEKNRMNALVFCSKDLVADYLSWARESEYAYNILVWKKPTAIPIGGSYRPDVEYLLAFRKSGTWNSGIDGVSYSKVLEHGREKDKVHPTMKPVAMIENQLLISSTKGGIVVDLFGGSGSTLIACEKTGRKCFMMELDPHYVGVIIERWQKFTGQDAVRADGVKYNEI